MIRRWKLRYNLQSQYEGIVIIMAIGFDGTFEMNEFGNPRIRSEIEVVKDTLLFILFSRPGQYPSLPMIGLDLRTMLSEFYEDIDIEELKMRVMDQCSALGVYFSSGSIGFKKIMYKDQPSLLIHIEGKESYPQGYLCDGYNTNNRYLIGITFDEMNNMIYNMNTQ